MNILNKVLIFVVILGSFVFSRSGASSNRSVENINQSRSDHYEFKDNYGDNGEEIDRRKRSHKRRRKIKRPRKGLR
jgi:hypothetical protein|tara:strand:+ start:1517 stop:1744 length:228 start_codon:yes stop_codon:yes gene_type:complete